MKYKAFVLRALRELGRDDVYLRAALRERARAAQRNVSAARYDGLSFFNVREHREERRTRRAEPAPQREQRLARREPLFLRAPDDDEPRARFARRLYFFQHSARRAAVLRDEHRRARHAKQLDVHRRRERPAHRYNLSRAEAERRAALYHVFRRKHAREYALAVIVYFCENVELLASRRHERALVALVEQPRGLGAAFDDGGVLGQRRARADDSHIVRARFGAGLFYLRGHGARVGMRSVGDGGDCLLAHQRRHPRRVEPPGPDVEARRFVKHLRAVFRRDAADHRQAALGYLARLGRAAEEQELLLHLNPCSRAA